jgi:hypothetical protein
MAFSMMVHATPSVLHMQHAFGLFGKNLGVSEETEQIIKKL